MAESLLSMLEALGLIPEPHKPGVAVRAEILELAKWKQEDQKVKS